VSKINVSCLFYRARGEDRWHSRTAEQNHGGVETGAIYGGKDTSQVNNKYVLFLSIFISARYCCTDIGGKEIGQFQSMIKILT